MNITTKKIVPALALSFVLAGLMPSYGSPPPGAGANNRLAAYSPGSATLDKAIEDIAAYFTQKLPEHSPVALVNFDAETRTLSDYIFEELWIYFEDHSSLVLVDRQNLELISKELTYQAAGEVSDESAKSIGQQLGPQVLLYGKLTRIGGEYRLTVYATDVERAASSMRAVHITPDPRLAALLEARSPESAVNMAHVLYGGKDNPFQFSVQTDKTNTDYHDGDYMTMQIYAARDVYIKVTHVDVHGNAQVIYPFSAQDDNFIRAGQTRRIPDNTRFKMTKPYGKETILVAAYDAPFTVHPQNAAAPLSAHGLMRGIVVENTGTLTAMQPVATAQCTYRITP
ncbi:MAG: DUF4384 domain-containing protein [Treponema sp.]|jgi:hypothetical protein|nr:DUF4384 domain-containing protein [Treponema sp.]